MIVAAQSMYYLRFAIETVNSMASSLIKLDAPLLGGLVLPHLVKRWQDKFLAK